MKRPLRTEKAARIYDNMERALLRERIGAYRYRLWDLKNTEKSLKDTVSSTVSQDLWETVERITQMKTNKLAAKNAANKEEKWRRLTGTSSKQMALKSAVDSEAEHPPSLPSEKRVIINLAGTELSKPAIEVLNKGLNFAVTPKRIPMEELVTSIETAITHLNKDEGDEIRLEAAHLLSRARPPKSNLTPDQSQALLELKKREDIYITKADKGNATVILDRPTYEEKMEQILDPRVYNKDIKDPTKKIETKITKILKTMKDKKLIAEMAPGDSKVPRIYGLPKIHKDGAPLRPIVSMIGAPTYNASKVLSRLLKPHTGSSFSAVKNSNHLVEILKSIKLEDNDRLVSFDVEALFTNLPAKDAVEIIKKKKFLEGAMMELAELAITSCYFQYKGTIYEQKEGVAMGSPLSPVVADIFMEEFETRVIEKAQHKPKLWLRYVDDVLAIWQHGAEELENFLELLNNFHPSIKFTVEEEKEGKLPFLDLLIIKGANQKLEHTVYRKPTATGRYLQAASHHHPAQKRSVIRTLTHRAKTLCSNEAYLKQEISSIKDDLEWNGYESRQVHRIINEAARKHQPETPQMQEPKKRITLPYVSGISEKVGRLFSKRDLQVAFKPLDKVGDWLSKTKDKQRLQDPGVYLLPCDCGKVYVGQTGKKIATRIGQHAADYRLRRTKFSAVATHGEECSKQLLFDEARTLAKEKTLTRRLIREALEIQKFTSNFNREEGLLLPTVWRPIIKKLERKATDRQHTKRTTQPEQRSKRTTPTTPTNDFIGPRSLRPRRIKGDPVEKNAILHPGTKEGT